MFRKWKATFVFEPSDTMCRLMKEAVKRIPIGVQNVDFSISVHVD